MRHIPLYFFILIGLILSGCNRIIETKNGVITKDAQKYVEKYLGDYHLSSSTDKAVLFLDSANRLELTLPPSIDTHCYTSLQPVDKIMIKRFSEILEIRAIFLVRSTNCGDKYLGREVHMVFSKKDQDERFTLAIHNGFSLQDTCEYYVPKTFSPNIFVTEDIDLRFYPEKFQEGEWTYELVYPGQSNLMRRCRKEMQPTFRKYNLVRKK